MPPDWIEFWNEKAMDLQGGAGGGEVAVTSGPIISRKAPNAAELGQMGFGFTKGAKG